jgi:hypothetical protein
MNPCISFPLRKDYDSEKPPERACAAKWNFETKKETRTKGTRPLMSSFLPTPLTTPLLPYAILSQENSNDTGIKRQRETELHKQNKDKRKKGQNRSTKTKYQISLLSCARLPDLFMCATFEEKSSEEIIIQTRVS